MSAVRALVVVSVLGCSHHTAAPVSPAAGVDHARLNLNAVYAALIHANIGAATARPSYADALAPTCRTSSDCGGAPLSCRAREDGVRVCMGVGSPGDACWFNTDCVSGQCALDDGERTCR